MQRGYLIFEKIRSMRNSQKQNIQFVSLIIVMLHCYNALFTYEFILIRIKRLAYFWKATLAEELHSFNKLWSGQIGLHWECIHYSYKTKYTLIWAWISESCKQTTSIFTSFKLQCEIFRFSGFILNILLSIMDACYSYSAILSTFWG